MTYYTKFISFRDTKTLWFEESNKCCDLFYTWKTLLLLFIFNAIFKFRSLIFKRHLSVFWYFQIVFSSLIYISCIFNGEATFLLCAHVMTLDFNIQLDIYIHGWNIRFSTSHFYIFSLRVILKYFISVIFVY